MIHSQPKTSVRTGRNLFETRPTTRCACIRQGPPGPSAFVEGYDHGFHQRGVYGSLDSTSSQLQQVSETVQVSDRIAYGQFKTPTTVDFLSHAALTCTQSTFRWIMADPFDPTDFSRYFFLPSPAPALRSALGFIRDYAGFLGAWYRLVTMGFLGHHTTQPRRPISTATRMGQHADQIYRYSETRVSLRMYGKRGTLRAYSGYNYGVVIASSVSYTFTASNGFAGQFKRHECSGGLEHTCSRR